MQRRRTRILNLMGSMLINIGKLTEEQAARQSEAIELAGDLTAYVVEEHRMPWGFDGAERQ